MRHAQACWGRDPETDRKITYESMFYHVLDRGKFIGNIKGFPTVLGGWCRHLKFENRGLGEAYIRETVLQHTTQKDNNEERREIQDGRYNRVSNFSCELLQQPKDVCNEKLGFSENVGGFSGAPERGAKINIVQYLGIADDETERIARHTKPGIVMPLVEIGWSESYCRQWCEENNMLSPIYTSSSRGGCWFCHNQSINQLRILRKEHPELWSILMKWDSDSPVSFKPDGHTVHDFDNRFEAEDAGYIPKDKVFRWKMVDEYLSMMEK